jgi:hypothetical protein
MTKKDYIALSKIFRGLHRAADAQDAVLTIASRLTIQLGKDNPSFDADRFQAACRKEYER